MSNQSLVDSVRRSFRRLQLSVSLACVGLVIGGSLVWGRSVEFLRDSESAPAVFFRSKPTMALQPRPVTAPLRNFELVPFQTSYTDQKSSRSEEGSGVILLGIEELDPTAGYATLQPPMQPPIGTWSRKR